MARLIDETVLTATGAILGTPSYMAPEQAAGRTREVGPAADIYALGAILYECLTGRPPFKGCSLLDTLKQVTETEPIPPRRHQPAVPAELESVCLKCLAKEPMSRYASATELADDLARWQRGERPRARRPGAHSRLLHWGRRQRHVLLAGLVSAVVAAGLIWALVWKSPEKAGEERQAPASDVEAFSYGTLDATTRGQEGLVMFAAPFASPPTVHFHPGHLFDLVQVTNGYFRWIHKDTTKSAIRWEARGRRAAPEALELSGTVTAFEADEEGTVLFARPPFTAAPRAPFAAPPRILFSTKNFRVLRTTTTELHWRHSGRGKSTATWAALGVPAR